VTVNEKIQGQTTGLDHNRGHDFTKRSLDQVIIWRVLLTSA